MTRDWSQRETALLSTHDLCLGRQRHHHVHGRRRHDDRHLQLHIRLSTMPYGPEITSRKKAYGPLHYRRLKALQVERVPWKQRLKALEGRQWLVGDFTCNNWLITGQKVRERTIPKSTWKKIHVRTRHSENYTLVTVLCHSNQREIQQMAGTAYCAPACYPNVKQLQLRNCEAG